MPSEQERVGLHIQSMREAKPELSASQCHDLIMARDKITLDRASMGRPKIKIPNGNGTSH